MGKAVKFSTTIFVLLFIFFVSFQTARACWCGTNPPVDRFYEETPNIAVLKVQSMEKYADDEWGYGADGIKQAKLTVERVYKGDLKVGQELTFAQGQGGDCIWTFDKKDTGQEILFYLGEKPVDSKSLERAMSASFFSGAPAKDAWRVGICSRSGEIKHIIGDIKYIENVSKVRGKTRLSGRLSGHIPAATVFDKSKHKLLSNHKIIIKGNSKNIELKTDKDGFYEIYDLPAGKYKISPQKINGYKIVENYYDDPDGTALYKYQDSLEITIRPKGHTEQNINLVINNRKLKRTRSKG